MTETLMQWGIGLGVTAAIAAFIRFYPKQKLMDWFGPIMFNAGKLVSKLGNSKLGKKAMNQVEEGILHTIIAVLMCGLTEFGKGLFVDNFEESKK